jgi:hypothetical protein
MGRILLALQGLLLLGLQELMLALWSLLMALWSWLLNLGVGF